MRGRTYAAVAVGARLAGALLASTSGGTHVDGLIEESSWFLWWSLMPGICVNRGVLSAGMSGRRGNESFKLNHGGTCELLIHLHY